MIKEKQKAKRFYCKGNNREICFQDFVVGIGDKELFTIDGLCISDRVTVIRGESGSGKSVFLKVIGGIDDEFVWSKGNVLFSIPEATMPNIVWRGQYEDSSTRKTLLDLVTSQDLEDAKKQEAFMRDLIKETDLEVNNNGEGLRMLLREEQQWAPHLTSGGIRQKVTMIGIVLQNPDIVTLDEKFSELDSESAHRIQNMFDKYLPDTQFLIVDHFNEENSWNDFYRQELHIENGTIVLRDLTSGQNIENAIVGGETRSCVVENIWTE